jgi:rhodanese-related sulfurtransferase
MTDTTLARARAAARENNTPYAGDVTPLEAAALVASGAARVIDVRCRYEWEFVGRIPDSTLIEWRIYEPDGAAGIKGRANDGFAEQLRAAATPEQNLLFLCRSGVRSQGAAAAAVAAGFPNAFNILEGFEGNPDEHKHRGNVGGWRKHGLPWIQG